MIPINGKVDVVHMPLANIVIEDGHALDTKQIKFYCELLEKHQDQSTDPILLAPGKIDGTYNIYNGRHRFVAHLVLGRACIWSLVIRKT